MTQNVEDHIMRHYKLLRKVGSGAYGHVWKVQQIKTGKILALKKIFDAFQHSTDAQRTYREIILLHQIHNENIVKLFNVIRAQNDKDLYLVFQFMEADLHNAIGQKILKDLHNRYLIFQLVRGIQYLHNANIIHRDLKPSNLLINSDCSLKICDLGLARTIQTKDFQEEQIFTEEVATRWYRAPEVLLGSQTYGQSADVWSIGCVLAEMLIGKPFFPGSSTVNQLERILSFTGKPNKTDIQSIRSPLAESMLESIGKICQKQVKEWFRPQIKEQAVDLVQRTVVFNPQKRLSIEQILQHPYLHQFNKLNGTIRIEKIYSQISDNKKKTVKQYKRLIYEWINKTYKVNQENQVKSSVKKDVCRMPLKQSINEHFKKSLSVNHTLGSPGSCSFIKQSPTCPKKRVCQASKTLASSASIKKLLKCNSQKLSQYASINEEIKQSPLSTSYKDIKKFKERFSYSGKNPFKKPKSLFEQCKQKGDKIYSMSLILNKFSKPSVNQTNFGTLKNFSTLGKNYF